MRIEFIFNHIVFYYKLIDQYFLNLLIGNQTLFYILCTVIIMKIKEYSRRSKNKAALTYLIGTFLHELSHYLIGYIFTFKRPTTFSIFPEEYSNGKNRWYVLGYVSINNNNLNIFNRFPIAFAPLLLIIVCYFISKYFLFIYSNYFPISFFSMSLYIFLVVTIFVNSIPSSADFEMAKKGGSLFVWLLSFFMILVIYYGVNYVK